MRAGDGAWRGRGQLPAAARQGCRHLGAEQGMQELGSKPPHFSQLLPIAAAVPVPWGPQRDTAALELFFLLFSPIPLLLLIVLHAR